MNEPFNQVDSPECDRLLHPINLSNAAILTNDTGAIIYSLFQKLQSCLNHSTFVRGGTVFFITNVPCDSMCTQLYKLIEEQDKYTDFLNSIGYVFRIIYFDDLGNLDNNPLCQVKSLFDYCNTYADVFQIKNDWEAYAIRLYTCPPTENVVDTEGARHELQSNLRSTSLGSGVVVVVPNEYCADCITPEKRETPDHMRIGDEWEIAEDQLSIHENEILGKGAFAVCCKGTLKGQLPATRIIKNLNLAIESIENVSNEVAVKLLPTYADEASRVDFFKEIDFMKTLGYHAHIVSLIGCVSNPFAPKIVTELCANGDLLRFLRNNRLNFVANGTSRCDEHCGGLHFDTKDLISIAWQVCDGMCYLSSRKLVHRDLAARNVLLTKNLVAKIGDFGLCRYVDQALYTPNGGRLPVKWMAIESLRRHEYTTKSDVVFVLYEHVASSRFRWSYAVLLFELFSLGDAPFPDVHPRDIISHLDRGNRNEKPTHCPDEIYSLMCRCWDESPSKRPTFEEIKTVLAEMLRADDAANDYLTVVENDTDAYLMSISQKRRMSMQQQNICSQCVNNKTIQM
ncbi:unnamed protein product [Anisakis simplex]|uniref:Putative tyrosine-protein kinase (inferred by orthology to a C. elegans protein) n=1 Tax=Anisakis simplex TaxID=6269 RepID=A0A0M3K2M7_ANISI|nr:unnamed protein product [Anisakis simplex]